MKIETLAAKARAIRLGDICNHPDPHPAALFRAYRCTRPLYHDGRHYYENVDRILEIDVRRALA